MAITFKLTELGSGTFETHIEEVRSFDDCYKKIADNKNEEAFTYSWNRADNIKNFGTGFIYKNKFKSNNKTNGYLREIKQKKISKII